MDTFKVVSKNGTQEDCVITFRPILAAAIARQQNPIVDVADGIVFFLPNLHKYEGEDGSWVMVE